LCITLTGDIATAGQDYEFTSGTATIPVGATQFAIPVRILGDNTPENSESFTMVILKVEFFLMVLVQSLQPIRLLMMISP
jgi:hypothetical protein